MVYYKKGDDILENTKRCIDKYMADGHLSNIAIRVGKGDNVLFDLYKSKESEINESTLFDMASVTKIIVTTTLAFIAKDKGLLTFDMPVSEFFPVPEDKKCLTVKNLLTHTIGIGHKWLMGENNNNDNIAEYVLSIPSDKPIGTEVMYSCPGYILLGKIVEKVFGKRLDEAFYELVKKPLELNDTSFLPDKEKNLVNSNVKDEEKGIVNDMNCRFLGCIAGNAGLFSDITDVTKYVKMLLGYGDPLIKRETFCEAIKNYTGEMSASRGLGFLYVDERYSQTGKLFPVGSIGHCGHTGQSVFVDIKSGLYVIILSDATISTVKKYKYEDYSIVTKMREDIHNAIKKDLEV